MLAGFGKIHLREIKTADTVKGPLITNNPTTALFGNTEYKLRGLILWCSCVPTRIVNYFYVCHRFGLNQIANNNKNSMFLCNEQIPIAIIRNICTIPSQTQHTYTYTYTHTHTHTHFLPFLEQAKENVLDW